MASAERWYVQQRRLEQVRYAKPNLLGLQSCSDVVADFYGESQFAWSAGHYGWVNAGRYVEAESNLEKALNTGPKTRR